MGGPPNLEDHFREKSSKYKHLGLPVVIAVVPAEGAAVTYDLLDVVEGQEVAQLILDNDGDIISCEPVREPSRLRTQLPETTVAILYVGSFKRLAIYCVSIAGKFSQIVARCSGNPTKA